MNVESSRSHSVFSIYIESKVNEGGLWKLRKSQFHFVDLAGSERQKKTEARGERLKEGCNINRSLSVLGGVINALVESMSGKKVHIRYRDSKLTFLLRDSLGGNSKTAMVANISPAASAYHETLSTLQFAQRAKMIRNRAILNEDTSGDREALQLEVRRLKEELANARLALNGIGRMELQTSNCGIVTQRDDVEQLQMSLDASLSALMNSQAYLQCEVARKSEMIKTMDKCFSSIQSRELQCRLALRLAADRASRLGEPAPSIVYETFNYDMVAENLILKERLWRHEQVRPNIDLDQAFPSPFGLKKKVFNSFENPSTFVLGQSELNRDLFLSMGHLEKSQPQSILPQFGDKIHLAELSGPLKGSEAVYQVPPDIQAELETMRIDLLQSEDERDSLRNSLDYLKEAFERQTDSHNAEILALQAEIRILQEQRGVDQSSFIDQLASEKDETTRKCVDLSDQLKATKIHLDIALQDLAKSQSKSTEARENLEKTLLAKSQLVSCLAESEVRREELSNSLELISQECDKWKKAAAVYESETSVLQAKLEQANGYLEATAAKLISAETDRSRLEEQLGSQSVLLKHRDVDLQSLDLINKRQSAIIAETQASLHRAAVDRNAALQQYNALHNALGDLQESLESGSATAIMADLVEALSFKQQARIMKKALHDREQLLLSTREDLGRTKAQFRNQLAALKRDFDILEVDYSKLQTFVRRRYPADCPLIMRQDSEEELETDIAWLVDSQPLETSALGGNRAIIHRPNDQNDSQKKPFRHNINALNRPQQTTVHDDGSKGVLPLADVSNRQPAEPAICFEGKIGASFEDFGGSSKPELEHTIKQSGKERAGHQSHPAEAGLLGKREPTMTFLQQDTKKLRSGKKIHLASDLHQA